MGRHDMLRDLKERIMVAKSLRRLSSAGEGGGGEIIFFPKMHNFFGKTMTFILLYHLCFPMKTPMSFQSFRKPAYVTHSTTTRIFSSDTNERLCARPRAKNGHKTILFPVSPMGHVILIKIFISPYLFATVQKYPAKQLLFAAFGNLSFSYLFRRF